MNINDLEAKVRAMEKELNRLTDIEEIRKLQRVYGYYLTNFMNEELIACFSDSPETTLEWAEGTFLGKEGVKMCFGNTNKNLNPEFMHQMMQIQGVVDIAVDGKTAYGRWWAFGAMAIPETDQVNLASLEGKGIRQYFSCGVYENEYVKEADVWKILKLKWVPLYKCTPLEGWVKPEKLFKPDPSENVKSGLPSWWKPHLPGTNLDYKYPSGYILPFHFTHPVTGKKSTEWKRNARVKGLKTDEGKAK